MSSRSIRYLLSLLSFALIFLPGYTSQAVIAGTSLILTEKDLFRLIIMRIPALFLLGAMFLYLNPDQQKSAGLTVPAGKDWIFILPLLVFTLGVGMILPVKSTALTLRVEGVIGILAIFGTALSAALIEELYFRSWLLSTLPSLGWPSWLATVFSVLLFTSGHLWEGFAGIVLAAASGALFSLFFLSRRNVLTLIVAHTVHNLVALGLYAGR